MFFVAILNVIGALLSPLLSSPKILPSEGNLKELYQNIASNKENFNDEKREPQITPKIENTKTPTPKPEPTPTPTPKPTILIPTPTPKITPNIDINEKIALITARFLDDYAKIKNSKENILNIIKEIFNKFPSYSKLVLAKLKLMDYPIDYFVTNATIKVSYFESTKDGFIIRLNKQNIVNKIVFVPITNKSCAATKFTVTAVSEKESLSFLINIQTGKPELQEFSLNLPIYCDKLIISAIETFDNISKIACTPYFGIFGPGVSDLQ